MISRRLISRSALRPKVVVRARLKCDEIDNFGFYLVLRSACLTIDSRRQIKVVKEGVRKPSLIFFWRAKPTTELPECALSTIERHDGIPLRRIGRLVDVFKYRPCSIGRRSSRQLETGREFRTELAVRQPNKIVIISGGESIQ